MQLLGLGTREGGDTPPGHCILPRPSVELQGKAGLAIRHCYLFGKGQSRSNLQGGRVTWMADSRVALPSGPKTALVLTLETTPY